MSMFRPSRIALPVLLVVSLVGSKVARADVKLGFVDLQRALTETEDGKKAKASLKKIFDQKQKELDEQQDDVKKAIDDLDKKRTLLPPDKVHDKEAEIQVRMQKIQQAYVRHQQDLQQKEQEAMSKIIERMNKILLNIAKSEGFTMIFDRSTGGVAYAKAELDLTNDLIRRYNAGEGGDGGPAAAKTPPPKK